MGHDARAGAFSWPRTNAAATLNYDLRKHVGYIEKGRYADLVGVSGDPMTDITEMEKIKFVMKGGTVFRDELTKGAPPGGKLMSEGPSGFNQRPRP